MRLTLLFILLSLGVVARGGMPVEFIPENEEVILV